MKRPWHVPFPSSAMENDAAARASASSASRRRASSASAASGSTASSNRRPSTRRSFASCSPAMSSRNRVAAAGTQSSTASGRSSTASAITRAWSVRRSPVANPWATSSWASSAFASRAVRWASARVVCVACDHQLVVDVAPVSIPAPTASACRRTRMRSASTWPRTRVSDSSACSLCWVDIDHNGRSITAARSASSHRANATTSWSSKCAIAVMHALFQRGPTVGSGAERGLWIGSQEG